MLFGALICSRLLAPRPPQGFQVRAGWLDWTLLAWRLQHLACSCALPTKFSFRALEPQQQSQMTPATVCLAVHDR